MGHDAHDDKKGSKHPSGVDLPDVKPHHYLETKLSTRARPQWDPRELAHAMLDDMEKGGRLHLRKKKQR